MSIRFRFLEKYLNAVRQNRLNLFILFLVFPWLVPLAGYLIWGQGYFSGFGIFVAGSVLNLSFALFIHLVNQRIAELIANVYRDADQSVYRVTLWFVLFSVINVLALYLILSVYDFFGLFGFVLDISRSLWAVFAIVAASLVGSGLSELSYTFMQWRTNQFEFNQLEQSQLQSELDTVKQQVNPHFLFNCLNSLSVLISEAPATAEKFVDEMAKVYRYLLQVNGANRDTNLVTLDAEIRFISSYIYLLETRFENGIRFTLKIEDLCLSGQIAPLSLQTLIDNAIRHNIVSAEQPLHISIRTTITGQLEVRNNLQKRTVRTPFNSEGLSTLMRRYKLMFNQAGTVQVSEDASSFTVLLPLIHT